MLATASLAVSPATYAAPTAAAVPAPYIFNAQYEIDWLGLKIGRINVDSTEDATSYHLTLDTKSGGVASLFSDERTLATIEGHRDAQGNYFATTYDSKPQKDSKGHHTTLQYDGKGHLVNRTREPDDDPAWRPPVPPEEANTASDPITAGFTLRRKLFSALALENHEASVRTYDGARLAEMSFQMKNKAKVEILGSYRDAVNLVVTRHPIDGYTPKEKKKYAAGDPEIHLYFSDDAAFVPIKATVDSTFGQITATLVRVTDPKQAPQPPAH